MSGIDNTFRKMNRMNQNYMSGSLWVKCLEFVTLLEKPCEIKMFIKWGKSVTLIQAVCLIYYTD